MPPSSSSNQIFGNVIEYIQDRLYLACYTATPTASTPFPPPPIPNPYYGSSSSSQSSSSYKRSKRSDKPAIRPGQKPVYFSIDDYLLYNAFFHDFGPLHVGHLYRFAVALHDILGEKKNEGKSVVFWSKCDSKSRSNAATVLACYMVLIQSWPPHLALAPIAQCDPPFMPFRDAGYSQADYVLSIQDVVYGIWKAKEKGILNIKEFCLEEYEKFERVDMGDFNWISPNFLAFASPQHKLPPSGQSPPAVPKSLADLTAATNISPAFKNVLHHFVTRDVGLVVRLNEELYPAQYFTALGITHLDMYFDDGTCPSLSTVRRFINLAHCAITVHKKNIAVHCKAGLGRTGCLIGAYLIYRYGFTANEVIAYMRFMRPGMVVGPQQHWLHINQGAFREWYFEDTYSPANSPLKGPSTPSKSKRIISGQTPPAQPSPRRVLGEVDANDGGTAGHGALPAPTPGQPRKTSKRFPGHRIPSAATSVYEDAVDDQNVDPEVPSQPYYAAHSNTKKKKHSGVSEEFVSAEDISEEEILLRECYTKRRTSHSKSPKGSGKRSSSYTVTTTTTTTTTSVGTTPPSVERDRKSGSGVMAGVKVRTSPRRQLRDEASAAKAGVRKISGRVGSKQEKK